MQQPRDWPVTSQANACAYRMHHLMTSQADNAWALLFQFYLRYTFTPAISAFLISQISKLHVHVQSTKFQNIFAL
jgi:hypothetical protein